MIGITNSFVLEEIGSKSWPVLWTNSNPTSNFAAQTVPIDLSDWSWIAIGAAISTSGTSEMITLARKGTSTTLSIPNIGSTQYFYKRTATISSSGVQFTTGYRNTSGTTGTSYCIPLHIYGVPGSNIDREKKWVPLWQNPDLTVAFAEQTITVDLSDWETIGVKLQYDITSPYRETQYITVGETSVVKVMYRTFTSRIVETTQGSVTFGRGRYHSNITSTTLNDDDAIPVAIYGIN